MFIFLYALDRSIKSATLYVIANVFSQFYFALVSRAANIRWKVLASFLDRGSNSKFSTFHSVVLGEIQI
jgi:hypothetical protein